MADLTLSNPNANYFNPGQGGNPFPSAQPAPLVPSTMDAGAIASNQTSGGIQFPTNQPSAATDAANAAGTNASIPSPQAIIAQETETTPAEATNNKLLTRLAGLIGGQKSLATQQTTQEAAAGVPDLTKTVNGLTTQLQGLNDQATALANDANYTIPNQAVNDFTGRASTGDIKGQTDIQLRTNQIKQGAIATQSLTVKSALYAAQGNLTLAKDAADKAAQVAFDADTQQINYQKALIDANKPQMDKEEQIQAEIVKARLADRETQIEDQKKDYTNGIALINGATVANGDNPQAQLAIQQARALDPKDPQYLSKVGELLTRFQKDPIAAETAIVNLQRAKSEALKAKYEADALKPVSPNDPTTLASVSPNNQSILAQTGLSVAAFKYLTDGTSALSRMTSADRKKIMTEAETYLNKTGTDISTFASQYKAYNDVLEKNITRANQTSVFGGEISGTVDQFITDIGTSFGKLKVSNVAQLLAGQQVNDPVVQKYAFDLQTMQNDLAGYYAASRGTSQPDDSDLRSAANVIVNGINSGSAKAFKDSIIANEGKVTAVVNHAADSARQQVWSLFGVGDKYQSKVTATPTGSTAKEGDTHLYQGVTYKLINGTWKPQ